MRYWVVMNGDASVSGIGIGPSYGRKLVVMYSPEHPVYFTSERRAKDYASHLNELRHFENSLGADIDPAAATAFKIVDTEIKERPANVDDDIFTSNIDNLKRTIKELY